MRLLHGTTRYRAEQILAHGPNSRYRELGGRVTEDGFFMYLEAGPFHFGAPADHAKGKATRIPGEGDAVLLVLEVPDEIVFKAGSEWLTLNQGLVQFDHGAGMEELIAAWPKIRRSAEIRGVV